jgi:hypothetical protein
VTDPQHPGDAAPSSQAPDLSPTSHPTAPTPARGPESPSYRPQPGYEFVPGPMPAPGPWAPPGYGYYVQKPPPYIPGPLLYGITCFLTLLGLYGASLPELGPISMLAIFGGLTVGLVWLSAFLIASTDTRMHFSLAQWARWTGIPAICFLCITLMTSTVPVATRFELSRPALDQAVANVKAGHNYGRGWIGLIPVDSVRVSGSTTLFSTSGSAASHDECGLAYDPSGPPDSSDWLDNADGVTDYGNGWWHWCQYGYVD